MTTACLISDTHNGHKKLVLPNADILIHSGDFTSMGHEHEVKAFLKWFSKVGDFKYRIFIAGNHDWLFDTSKGLAKSLIPSNLIYLEDDGVEVLGLNIYGTPVSPVFFDWAFMKEEFRLKDHWEAVPDDTDILITHCPPKGILDFVGCDYTGSSTLYYEVTNRIKPLVSVFGHIHDKHGVIEFDGTHYINACNANVHNKIEYPPIHIGINDDKVEVFSL